MITSLPPALVFIIGAMLVPLCGRRLKQSLLLFIPLLALVIVHTVPEGTHWTVSFLDYNLVLGQVDRLSRVFGYIFCIISVIAILFALQVEDDLQHMAALCYAGAALGVTFAGDWFSLYLFWEVMAVASTFLILASRTEGAQKAAFRYILVHLFGGLVLLAGIILYFHEKGSLTLGHVGLDGAASWLIFIGIALNAAVPPLHPWLKDAYPESTPTGAVFLSAFTTKSAVYLMARTFAGAEVLIWIGAIMTIYPIFFAVLENNIRRVLSYSLINQVGFMMCGIGIGTQLAINGTVSHAFAHILYKALLFMAAGSVLHVTGKIKCTELGGLYKYMPLTCLACLVGSASISAFPLFSGFVSKSMIVSAAGGGGLVAVWFLLQFASVGVIDHAGIKVPFFTFFSHDSGLEAHDPPKNMLIAMGIAALFCIGIGTYPEPLYAILPYPVDYAPYTGGHVVTQLQLLLFGAFAFCLLLRSGLYPAEINAINLDFDWIYRRGGQAFYRICDAGLNGINRVSDQVLVRGMSEKLGAYFRDGPSRLALSLARPLWSLKGISGQELERRQDALRGTMQASALPVGLAAAMALVMLILVFVF